MTELRIIAGNTYNLGGYKRELVRVTAVNPDTKSWYDDGQGGGWWSKGEVEFTFSDGEQGWESLEYAKDNWSALCSS